MLVDATLQTFKLRGRTLDLYISPDSLFIPNAVTRLFSKVVAIEEGDTVFDIGTGVGVLAVWAALQPSAVVYAVDPVRQHCALVSENAERHHVAEKIHVCQGSLFDPLPADLRADVIVGDVSGIADAPGKALGWYSDEVPTGGGDGTEVVIQLLRTAGRRLAPGGKLYFPVAIGLSEDTRVTEVARQYFGSLKQVVDVWFPLSEQEYEICTACLPEPMLSRLRRRGSRMAWNGHIYEATQPIGVEATEGETPCRGRSLRRPR
jgi:methylase of polypeptide subunit release factors